MKMEWDNDIGHKPKKKPTVKGKEFALCRTKAKQKTIINKMLARSGRRDRLAIVLDGENAQTTKELIKSGWKKSSIHIPNFSEDYKKILRKGYNAQNISLREMLEYSEQESIGLLYADYMCSMDGNENCSPLNDIDMLFEGKKLADGAAFGITIALRTRITADKFFVNNAVQKVISHITIRAFENGYIALLTPIGGVYKNGGPMWTGIFQVVKNGLEE